MFDPDDAVRVPIRRTTLAQAIAVLVAAVCLVGCSKDSGIKTVAAYGTVQLKGSPVAGAIVVLHAPAAGALTSTFQAESDDKGAYRFQTPIGPGKFQDGVPPGEYQVSLSKLDTSQLKQMTGPPQDLFPKKYTEPSTSGLKAVVTESSECVLAFDIR